MRNNSTKCNLFLKTDSSFPLKEPKKVILIGTGVRLTTKKGTVTENVESPNFIAYEECLEKAMLILNVLDLPILLLKMSKIYYYYYLNYGL